MALAWLAHAASGMALAVAAWLLPRHIAGARVSNLPALLLDAAPMGLIATWLGLASGRPVFAGLLTFACGGGFALADHTMRLTLREPVVFSESVELPQVFTHPHLYLPFAGPGLVIGGFAGAVVAGVALLLLEPPLWQPQPLAGLVVAGFAIAAGWAAIHEPLLGRVAAGLRALRPTLDPAADAARLGPFAMLLAHGVIARAERPERRRRLAAPALVGAPVAGGRPIILVQCESFFDVRRLCPRIGRCVLPNFAVAAASAAMYGRLSAAAWGANTMRAEFAVLSGIPEDELGYDRFNPYYALARLPIASQVWRLRQAGYRTICLHPFDARFFRRDLAMPALGFETFLDRVALGGGRAPPYLPDPELARHVLRLLDAEGPRCFVFVITMDNHGPWLPTGPAIDPAVAELYDAASVPHGAALQRYLDGLRRSDEMLGILKTGLERRGCDGVLGFYGDHLPSLAQAFRHFGFDEPHSDYVIWPSDALAETPRGRVDLPAHLLGRTIVDAVLGAPRTDALRPALAAK